MNSKFLRSELLLAGFSVVLIILVVATRSKDMSGTVQTMLLGVFGAATLSYGALVYKEKPADEREHEQSLLASKHAYLAVSVLLVAATVYQSFNHELEPVLPVALGVGVVVKALSHLLQNK